jgi:ABC-type cobalamin transport system permease subunit
MSLSVLSFVSGATVGAVIVCTLLLNRRVRRLEEAMLYHIGVSVGVLLSERDYFVQHPEELERIQKEAMADAIETK